MRSVIAANVALLLLLLSIASPTSAAQTIRFPDTAVGSVLIRPEATANFGYETMADASREGWQEHCPAAGNVIIPDGFAVRLELNRAAAGDLSWLDEIPADAIDVIRAHGVPLGDHGFERLSRLVGLRHLSLGDAGLTSAIATHLPHLRHLKYLWLDSNAEVGDDTMSAVAELPELHSIGVHMTGVTDAGFEALCRSKSIQAIYAGGTRITDAAIAAVAQLPDLRVLNLYADAPEFRGKEPHPSLTDAGLAYLRGCPNLEYLNVCGS